MRIKRNILLILALLSLSVAICAQPRLREPEMYVGIHGGVMAATMNFSPVVAGMDNLLKSAVLGGNGGLLFRYIGHKYCGLQVELNYMPRGWGESWTTDSLSGTYQRRLDYIELPFLMHLYFGSNKNRGFINLGPEIGFCLYDTSRGEQHPASKYQYGQIDSPFDWGIAVAAGYYGRTDKCGAFQFDLRFNYSLSDTFSHRKTAYFNHSAAMNLSLNVAYMWEIKQNK